MVIFFFLAQFIPVDNIQILFVHMAWNPIVGLFGFSVFIGFLFVIFSVYIQILSMMLHKSISFRNTFTFIGWEGGPFMRYALGDLIQVFTEPCPCGRSGFRYKIIGRSDDMLKVKGVMVYPSHIKGVINEFIPRVTGEMRIVLDEKPPRVVPPLKVRVEHSEGVTAEGLKDLEKENNPMI